VECAARNWVVERCSRKLGRGGAVGNWVVRGATRNSMDGCSRKLGHGGATGKWALGAFWVPLVH